MPKCIELLPCDWLISYLCYQAIEQVYLIKWPVSVFVPCWLSAKLFAFIGIGHYCICNSNIFASIQHLFAYCITSINESHCFGAHQHQFNILLKLLFRKTNNLITLKLKCIKSHNEYPYFILYITVLWCINYLLSTLEFYLLTKNI